MKIDKNYVEFIQSIKRQIVQSRYAAARLANREQLLLYYKTGMMISDKIKAQKWGAKVLDQISTDLQKELPGLKGFSSGNLKKIRIFAEAYSPYLTIGSTPSNQIGQADFGLVILFQLVRYCRTKLKMMVFMRLLQELASPTILQFSLRSRVGKPGYSISKLRRLIFGP